ILTNMPDLYRYFKSISYIFNYIQDFTDGKISQAAFWELAKFKKPTHQISCHTARALETLTFKVAYEVYDEK
ncbi:MAG: DUF3990 domain-containing protein, partial [Treponema sp.]